MCRMENYKRVLFIAPSDSGLDVAPEIDSLSELGYEARALQGEVSAARVFEAVRRSRYDIVHFACHSLPDQGGLALSRGEALDIDGILQVVRMADAKLVFLNACDTARLGQILVDEHVMAVITTLIKVDDKVAKQTAQTFYQQLALTGNPHGAFKAARPATRAVFQWLTNGTYQELMLQPIMTRLDEITDAIGSNEAEHVEFRLAMRDACDFRRWSIKVTIASVFTTGVVVFLITVLMR
jgi:hypothetical protein